MGFRFLSPANDNIMSKPKTRKDEARRRRIKKLMRAFKKKYPKQYKGTVEIVKDKRKKLSDKDYGTIDDPDWEELDVRISVETPEKLHDWMDVAINNPNFLETKEELHWFMDEYPEFKVPKKY